jgi:ribosomal protein RSM22 (predicted rRNA methylase)
MMTYTLPQELSYWIGAQVRACDFHLDRPGELAPLILKLSDQYQNPESLTPWEDSSFWAAYFSYFMPLNYVRTLKVMEESRDWNFFEDTETVVDFGCGPGTLTQALSQDSQLAQSSFIGVDRNPHLNKLYQSLPNKSSLSFQSQLPKLSPSNKALLVAGYSLNELKEIPPEFFHFQKIMILEPSTKKAFADLVQFRDRLIDEGYQILAPCPHHESCPLAESKKDWCHDRVYWEQPQWFQDLEKHLPIKNQSVTFSYLLATRAPIKKVAYQRIVGDPLKEKGKTRWMLCRHSEREFLSHLKRQGSPPNLSRGQKIQLRNFQKKGAEIRFEWQDLLEINEEP